MEIKSKLQMFDLQLNQKLGNCLQIWKTIGGVRKSNYDGPIAIRGLISGLGMRTHIEQKDLEIATEKYVEDKGCTKNDLVYSEMAAPSMGIIRKLNAQVTKLSSGLYLTYNTQNVHMPEAMKKPFVASNLKAKMVLEYYQDPCDFDALNDILVKCPDSVIEFSLLQNAVGWANRRMVIWEVRNY